MILLVSYLPYKQIDKAKWDECVAKSRNRLIYGFSFYLDKMAGSWDGLVLNDFEAVMPLPWRKKLGIKYLYQPAFMQQGGIYSDQFLSGQITNSFIEVASQHFSFAEIALNYGNNVDFLTENVEYRERSNYVLPLDNYQYVSRNYDDGFKKSLRRLKKFNLSYIKSDDYSSAIKLFKELYNNRLSSFSENDYINFKSVCTFLQQRNKLITRIVSNAEKTVLAALVLLVDGDRLYNLLSCITDTGKKFVANDFLYDKIIEEFSEQGMLLDLEGSDVKGIAEYYKKLNPILQSYPFIKYNNLPTFVKLFKK